MTLRISYDTEKDELYITPIFDEPKVHNTTGWSILFVHILSGPYDNNRICMKKIMVDLFLLCQV